MLTERQPFGNKPLTSRHQYVGEPLQGGFPSGVTPSLVSILLPLPDRRLPSLFQKGSGEKTVYILSHEEEASDSRNRL
jgi:hypothetical protein